MFYCITSKFGLHRNVYYGQMVGDRIHLTHVRLTHVSSLPKPLSTVPKSPGHFIGTVMVIPDDAEPINLFDGAIRLSYREDFEYSLKPAYQQYHALDFSPLIATDPLTLEARFKKMVSEHIAAANDSIKLLFTLGGITTIHIGDATFHRGNDPDITVVVSGELIEATTGSFKYTGS